jgi:HSP20 family protein
MVETFKKVGHDIGRHINRAWMNLTEGWRELRNRSGGALTRFRRSNDDSDTQQRPLFPGWGLVAGEVHETDREVVVQLEVPGLDRDDFDIEVRDNVLRIRGEKRYERDHRSTHYYLRERAYGRFERRLPLPDNVNAARARATCKNGVLSVRFPRTESSRLQRMTVH